MSQVSWGRKYPANKSMYGHSYIQFGRSQASGHGYPRVRTYVRCECGTRCSGQGDEGGMRSYRRHLLHKKPEIEKARKSEENMAYIRGLMAERYPAFQRFLERYVEVR